MIHYLCDKVFGKIYNNTNQQYNGIINIEGYEIVDALSDGTHIITLRGSGLSVIGNGTSNIFFIIKSITDSINDKIQIKELNSNIVLFKNTLSYLLLETPNYLKLYELKQYNLELCKIITKTKDEMKKFMQDNAIRNNDYEFIDITEYTYVDNTWYNLRINNNIKDIICKIQANLHLIRKLFYVQSNMQSPFFRNDFEDTPIQILNREYTIG